MSSPTDAENGFGDEVALDERRAAGDRRAACLVGQAEPPAGAGSLLGGVVEPELAGERFKREAEVGKVPDQRAEVPLAERGARAGRPGGDRAGDHPRGEGGVPQGPRPQAAPPPPPPPARPRRPPPTSPHLPLP